jgi:hypothetical protein
MVCHSEAGPAGASKQRGKMKWSDDSRRNLTYFSTDDRSVPLNSLFKSSPIANNTAAPSSPPISTKSRVRGADSQSCIVDRFTTHSESIASQRYL